MGFASFHAHKATAKKLSSRAEPNPTCSTGGFYKSPTSGSSIDSLQPLTISWDPTCISSQKVDIHLLAPWYNGETTEMTQWAGINNADGQKQVNILPKWWNATSSVQVQLAIVQAGLPPPMTPLPAGPVWTVTYTAPADGSTPASAVVGSSDASTGIGAQGTTKSPNGGKTAAAVLIPLLLVGGLLFWYLRFQRRKASEKSKRFSQAIDKRMSTISTDWKSMSAAGAQAAIRNSIAVNRDSSSFAFGGIRPSSTYSQTAEEAPQMKQVRTGTGVGLRHPGGAAAFAAERQSRISRVSFTDTSASRPSGESRRTRAFHSAYVPPVPTRNDVVSEAVSVYPDSEVEGTTVGRRSEDTGRRSADEHRKGSEESARQLSPRQTTGPLTLTPEDIRARIHGRSTPSSTSATESQEYDEVMPALSMMRTGSPTHQHHQTDEYLLPQHPAPAYTSSLPSAYSPASSGFTISAYASPSTPSTPPVVPVMSPDDLLRAYAVRKGTSSPAPTSSSPSSFASPASPKVKGRKLSIRASLGLHKKASNPAMGISNLTSPQFQTQEQVIGYPMPVAPHSPLPPRTPITPVGGGGAGMAGVGARSGGMGAGMAGVGVGGMMGGGMGAQYAIGEDEDDVYGEEDAYGGTYGGMAH
ncbi:hypothetical protein DXG01_013660 [Tephrocybe rancida]|nr:hypothetical protein DXG01_013660 [Tephrocybe rancida]